MFMHSQHLLTALLLTPLAGSAIVALSPKNSARNIAVVLSLVMLVLSGMLACQFDFSVPGMQFTETASWISSVFPVNYHVGVDGFSLCLILLTTIVMLAAVLASTSISNNRPKLYYSFVMLLATSIIGTFISLDLVQFFVLYELELVPMYFLIAVWGGPNRDYAAMKFLLYTFFGGIFMLGGLLFLYFQLGALGSGIQTFDMVRLAQLSPGLAKSTQLIACLCFLLAFIIKLPSFPFHTWLPDAHVEAPTPISMILAALLLKMGSYGLMRICVGFFPDAITILATALMALGSFNIVWAAAACLVQEDMKRVIALSSVSHMGFILLGIGSMTAAGLSGAIFQMISHGFISALLFFMVGTVYERCHTRSIPTIGGGLANDVPQLFYFWMFAVLANLGLPALSGFVGEVTVIYGSFVSPLVLSSHALLPRASVFVACTGVILTAGYMLWLLKRLFYGERNPKWTGHFGDATAGEMQVASLLAVFILALGVYPLMITNTWSNYTDRLASNLEARSIPNKISYQQ
jgi:NADH-quinone oxidoreductase subunit M